MGRYSAFGSQTITSGTADSTITIERGASKRAKIYDFTVGVEGTPADVSIIHTVQRGSASGTGTAFTPLPLDPADGACVATAETNHTIEPTYTANEELWRAAMNQRASYRWVAAPGSEMVIPDTAGALIGFFAIHASATPSHEASVMFEE